MSENSSNTQNADVNDVVDSYEQSVRNIVWYTIAGLAAYALMVGMTSLSSWWFSITGSDDTVKTQFTFTLGLSDGAAVLGVLTAVMIALHVVAWQIKPAGPLASLVHARRRLLVQIAGPLGIAAIITGAATMLHGAPDKIGIGQLAVGICAVVVAALAIDIQSALRADRDLHRRVDDVSRDRDAAAAEKVANRWATPRMATVVDTVWDLAKLSLITAVPLLVLVIVQADSRTIALLADMGMALLYGAFIAALMTGTVYGAVLSFVTRSHFNFLMCVLPAMFWVLSWGLAIAIWWISDASLTVKSVRTVTAVFIVFVPAALVAAGLRLEGHKCLPGRTARPQLYAALQRRHLRLSGTQARTPAVKANSRLARLSRRYKVVTGIEPDPSEEVPASA
ncbi:hypothetical protein [Rhodococcus sp. Q]|uniref:hypothetical protein n=1 Tax=Rhodococcus sp. Q TaxID=2502252 RepID=UPI0010F98631|nr:hypothetical protein [Rhodococcus sp. Q]